MADPLRVVPVTSPGELLHSLLAVSHAPAPEFLLSVNVAGFIYVSDVDVTRNTVRRRNPTKCTLFFVYGSRAKRIAACGNDYAGSTFPGLLKRTGGQPDQRSMCLALT